jgi:subtilisin family serine protease
LKTENNLYLRSKLLPNNLPATLALGLVVTLCGCGGGGGGGGQKSADSAIQIPPPSSNQDNSKPPWNSFADQIQDPSNLNDLATQFETDEYEAMGALAMINASSAYARGATGAGIAVGVIDSGVYEEHIEFAQGSDNKVEYAGSDYSSGNPRSDDAIGHGTLVAGIIAANRDGTLVSSGINMHGVAFDASILAYEIPLGSGSGPYDPLDVEQINFSDDNYFANRFNTMADQVDIINLSFGFSGVVTSYTEAQVESAFGLTIDALAQQNKSRSERSIFVFSAGNAWNEIDDEGNTVDADSPELMPGLPYLFPELKDHMLAVAAVDDKGEIAFYSNRCGVAADYCLVAPGGGDGNGNGNVETDERIWGPTPPDSGAEAGVHYYGGAIGTSFAAPVVSGSLALLKQMFPTVGNHELAARLLTTANKTGIYSDSSIYGQGLLDLDAATRPLGALGVASGNSLNSGLSDIGANTISVSGAGLGNSLVSALQGHTMALFDQQGFPFLSDASQLVQQSLPLSAVSRLQHHEQQLSNGTRLQLGKSSSLMTNPGSGLQSDYLALQFGSRPNAYADHQNTIDRFMGINANPGWFFGVYADAFVTPDQSRDDSSFTAPWLSFARNGWSSGGAMDLGLGKLRIGMFEGSQFKNSATDDLLTGHSEHHSNGSLLEYALWSPAFSLNFQRGFISEDDSFLGASFGQNLGQLKNSGTEFFGLNGHVQLNSNWQGIFAVYLGTTESGLGGNGLLENSGLFNLDNSVNSNSWSLGLNSSPDWQTDDRLSISLNQPLRVQSGQGSLQLATGRTTDRQVIYETVNFDLQPQGREQQLELLYQFKLGDIRAATRVEYTYQPHHNPHNPSYGVIEFSLFRAFTP